MAIIGIIGKPKSGKSLLMTSMMLRSHYDRNYCNIKIKDFEYDFLRSSADIESLPKDDDSKGIFIDELHQMGADSWSYDGLAALVARFGTQHRKYHADIVFTDQNLNQIINRIRNNIEAVYRPLRIIGGANGKPIGVKVAEIGWDVFGVPYTRSTFWWPLFFGKAGEEKFVCDFYDTYEFVEPMEPLHLTFQRDKFEEFKDKYQLINVGPRGGMSKNTILAGKIEAELVKAGGGPQLARNVVKEILGYQAEKLGVC
jgi:hypothetical protein